MTEDVNTILGQEIEAAVQRIQARLGHPVRVKLVLDLPDQQQAFAYYNRAQDAGWFEEQVTQRKSLTPGW